jgi:hypothetical protein
MADMKCKTLSFVFSAIALLSLAKAAADEVSHPAVAKSIRQEFGTLRGDYFVDRLVSDQIIMGLGIPNPERKISDGIFLQSGCRRHSCDEKSAVIVTAKGAMLAAGMIYLRCGGDPVERPYAPPVSCTLAPHLRIFMKEKNDRPAFVQELQDWAARVGYKGSAAERITLR